jgi:hypothetical protein
MLTTHKKASKIFWSFLNFANFYFVFGFAYFNFVSCIRVERGKKIRYKIPLVGALPQAGFRLTAASRGCSPSNASKPSTPPVAAAVSAP